MAFTGNANLIFFFVSDFAIIQMSYVSFMLRLNGTWHCGQRSNKRSLIVQPVDSSCFFKAKATPCTTSQTSVAVLFCDFTGQLLMCYKHNIIIR